MLKRIFSDTPLCVSLQENDFIPPSNFRYTVTCWFGEVCGIYAKQNPKLLNYFAVGTREGPILIIGDTGSELYRVSLLCGHSNDITCIAKTLHMEIFISISSDGYLCGWSMLDGTCIFSYQTGVQEGDLMICPSQLNSDMIFIWKNGGFAYKFNIRKQKIVRCFPFYGITSFITTEERGVCVCNHQIITLNQSFEIESRTLINRDVIKQYVVCENGIIEKKGNTICFMSFDGALIYSKAVDELDEFDSISYASWKSANATVVFLSGKLIVFSNNENENYQITVVDDLMMTNVVYYGTGMAGIHADNTIFVSDEKGIRKLNKKLKSQTIHIPDNSKPNFYISDRTNTIKYIVRGEEKRNYSLSDSSCRAIYTTKKRNEQYVICGSKNGVISVFNQKTCVLIISMPSISSSIISFAPTPFFVNGSRRFIAIGADGSLCLFNLSDSKTNYLGQHFRINQIFVNEAHCLIFVQYEDKSVLVFNLESPDPINIISIIPGGCVKIWSNSSTVITDELSSLGYTNVYGSEIVFNVYNFAKNTEPMENNELFTKEAMELFDILGYKQKEGKAKKSLILIGANNIPSFLYAPFAINESNLNEASPFIVVIFEMACSIITRITGIPRKNLGYDYVNCLPYLTQMIFKSPPEISNNAVLLLLNVIPNAKPQDYAQMISYLITRDDPLKFEDHEQLLLAIIATFNEQLVPPYFLKPLFKILQKFSWEESNAKHVAFSLMTDGMKTWCKGYSPVQYYEFLIKALANDNTSVLAMMVVHCAYIDFLSFLQAFKNVFIKQIVDGQVYPQMISLITNASLICENEGTHGTLLMAKLMSDFNLPLMDQHLEMHRSFFKNMDMKDEIIAIGTCDGLLSVFTKKKFDYDIHLFSRPISHVKIINDFIVICSIYERKYFVLSTTKKAGIFKNEKNRILEKNSIVGNGIEVYISLNEKGNVEVILK